MSLAARVAEVLGNEGPIAARWPHYEAREGQQRLACDIADTLEWGGVRLAEAPTGVGKSLAYLLPGVLHAIASGERVLVATCTRSLQDQLFERDLPQLLEVLELRVPAARLKGKQNYVCPIHLERTAGEDERERAEIARLRAWAAADDEGDLDRFPAADAEAFRRLRPRVAADRHACTAASCRRARECAWVRARRIAAQAKLVIVNHALLAVSAEAEGLLPDFGVLVVDEAHRLEGVLLGQLERSVSRGRADETYRRVGSGRRGQGLVPRLLTGARPLFDEAAIRDLEALGRRVKEARAAAEAFFDAVPPLPKDGGPYAARLRHRAAEDLLGRSLEPLEAALAAAAEVERGLRRLGAAFESSGGPDARDRVSECEQLAGEVGALRGDLDHAASGGDDDWVYWRTDGARGLELHASPVHAGALARQRVLGRARAVVLTSATLRTNGSFEFLAQRLGLGEAHGVPYDAEVYPTPFPLERQMLAFVHGAGGEESELVAGVVRALSAATPRNLLALFTSHERLRRARERLRSVLPRERLLLAQEWDGPAGALAERFRLERGAILLGVQSLWEGVDFPGEALEVLVVAKLPFAVPDDPLVEARGERLRDRGLDPFRDDALPEAVLRFRQGVGRLIRRADDRGVLVVCDPRLATASYRRAFLEALPVPVTREDDAGALAARAARFFEEAVTVEEA